MDGREPIIDAAKAKEYANDMQKVASAVESLQKHDGWKIFLALFVTKKIEIKDREDYDSLEDFRADRRAIGIVEDIIGTFDGYREDATQARTLFDKLADAENQTPTSISLGQDNETGIEG